MGYFDELSNRPLQWPYEEVSIVDRQYVYQQPVVVMLESAKNMFAKFDLKVKGTDGVKYFKGKSKPNKKVIYTLDGKPIVNIADSKKGKKVYLGKTEEKSIAKVEAKDERKFKVKFTNLATGQKSFFEMKCDKKFRICGIFYGKEKEGAPLVCKFRRDQFGKDRCGIEMAAGVDNMFLIALAHFFNNKTDYKKYLKMAAVGAAGVGAVGAAAAGAAALASHHHHHSHHHSHGTGGGVGGAALGGLAGVGVGMGLGHAAGGYGYHHHHHHVSVDGGYDSSSSSSSSSSNSSNNSLHSDHSSSNSSQSSHSDPSDYSNDSDSSDASDDDNGNDYSANDDNDYGDYGDYDGGDYDGGDYDDGGFDFDGGDDW